MRRYASILRRVAPVLLLSIAAVPAAAACAGQPGPGKLALRVVTEPLRNAQGEVAFTLYPDIPRRFLAKGGKLLRVRVPAVAPATRACFWVTPGHYAVAVYHDENGDHDFNRTLFTIKEGFGFSNDAPTTLGLPKFAAVRFAAPADGRELRIRMRYSR